MAEHVPLPAIASPHRHIIVDNTDTTASLLSNEAVAEEDDRSRTAFSLLRPNFAAAPKAHKGVKTPNNAGQVLKSCEADKMLAMPHFVPVDAMSALHWCHAGHAKSASRLSTHESSASSHAFAGHPHCYYNGDGMRAHRPMHHRDAPLGGVASRDVSFSSEADTRAITPHRTSFETRPRRWSTRSFSDIYTRPHLIHCICDADSSASVTTQIETTSYNDKADGGLRGNDSMQSAHECMANHTVHCGAEKPKLLTCHVKGQSEACGGGSGQLHRQQHRHKKSQQQQQRRARLLVPLREDPVHLTKYTAETNDDGYERASSSSSPPMALSLTRRESAYVGLCAIAAELSHGSHDDEWCHEE